MKKNYDIRIGYLEQIMDMLNTYDDEILEKDKIRLEMLIMRLKNNFKFDNEDDFTIQMQDDLQYLDEYRVFYPYVKNSIRAGLYVDKPEEPKYKRIWMSDKEAVLLAKDFFTLHGEFFSKQFDSFMEDADSHLKFVKPNINTNGEVLYLSSIGESFIFVPNYRNINKFTILAHEMEHTLDCFNNPSFFENVVIREAPAIFMELLACDYADEKIGVNNGNLRKLELHTLIKNSSYEVIARTQILNKYKKMLELGPVNFKKIGSENFLNYLFESSIIQNYYYQISYFIAVELYTIYQYDREKALFILTDIIVNGNDFNILSLLEKHGITLVKNYHPYEYELCKKTKVLF